MHVSPSAIAEKKDIKPTSRDALSMKIHDTVRLLPASQFITFFYPAQSPFCNPLSHIDPKDTNKRSRAALKIATLLGSCWARFMVLGEIPIPGRRKHTYPNPALISVLFCFFFSFFLRSFPFSRETFTPHPTLLAHRSWRRPRRRLTRLALLLR